MNDVYDVVDADDADDDDGVSLKRTQWFSLVFFLFRPTIQPSNQTAKHPSNHPFIYIYCVIRGSGGR